MQSHSVQTKLGSQYDVRACVAHSIKNTRLDTQVLFECFRMLQHHNYYCEPGFFTFLSSNSVSYVCSIIIILKMSLCPHPYTVHVHVRTCRHTAPPRGVHVVWGGECEGYSVELCPVCGLPPVHPLLQCRQT